jgi:hypothetical protein
VGRPQTARELVEAELLEALLEALPSGSGFLLLTHRWLVVVRTLSYFAQDAGLLDTASEALDSNLYGL